MPTVDQVKCACPDCVCIVRINDAVDADGRKYCGEACAKSHAGGAGCDHAGCKCCG